MALSGGTTPVRLYRLLARDPFRRRLDWERVEFFWGDERAVPPDHPESNCRMATEAFLGPLCVPAEHVHRMKAERRDLAAAARAYERELGRVLGARRGAAPPRFDLVLLGMGADGHTASLFPRSAALGERKRWVVAVRGREGGPARLTLTLPIINRAALVVFLVCGAAKARAVAAVLAGRGDREPLPAAAVRPASGEAVWFVDRAAARLLRRAGERRRGSP